ncbi:TPA: glycosyltransferase, partial [Escherichia coli]|nr:glycosyltransferase [Escherichia coli]
MNFINIEQPLVSIIMACYNSIKTIDESISSVINQDYKNFELIIA